MWYMRERERFLKVVNKKTKLPYIFVMLIDVLCKQRISNFTLRPKHDVIYFTAVS